MKIKYEDGKYIVELEDDELIDIHTKENENVSINSIPFSNTKKEKSSDITDRNIIIVACNAWLDYFKMKHDAFKEAVLSRQNKKKKYSMVLYFGDENKSEDKTISLEIINPKTGIPVIKGPSIMINRENIDVYNYLVAHVLSYYISENYSETQIDITNAYKPVYLFSNVITKPFSTSFPRGSEYQPLVAVLSELTFDPKYNLLALEIINNHNDNFSSHSIPREMEEKIKDQVLVYPIINNNEFVLGYMPSAEGFQYIKNKKK